MYMRQIGSTCPFDAFPPFQSIFASKLDILPSKDSAWECRKAILGAKKDRR